MHFTIEMAPHVTGSKFVVPDVPNTHMQQQTLQRETNGTKNIVLDCTYENIKFPFKWRYGKIVELLQQEKEELNRTRRYRNKLYKKPCALCGAEGCVEFRKKSNNNYSLICRECAEKYIRNANLIRKKLKH